MIGRAQIGLAVCSSLCSPALVCDVLGWREQRVWGLFTRAQKKKKKCNADFAIYKKKQLTLCSLCTAQMGNLQTNSSWSWMRHWQSLNTPQTIWVWLQLTTGANEFPRWDSGARQTNLETADNNRVIMLLLHRRLQDAPISTAHWVKRANNSRLHSLCKCHFAWNCNTWATALHLLQDYTHTHTITLSHQTWVIHDGKCSLQQQECLGSRLWFSIIPLGLRFIRTLKVRFLSD